MPVAARLLAERDIGQTVDGVKQSLSSWDGCMAHSYCKWPVIIGIIIGSLIILSLVWCLVRCLCCGVECCCGCLSCCNACCPSPRGKRKNDNSGYQQAPPTPYSYQQPPPMHPHYMSGAAGGGYRGANSVPQTATFDAPTRKYNEDALPAMPSWDTAKSQRVEETVEEDVELEKMDRVHSPQPPAHTQQQQALLASKSSENVHSTDRYHEGGDVGAAGMTPTSARPYHDYPSQQHLATSPYGSQRDAATGYFTGAQASPLPSPYSSQHGSSNNGYGRAEPYSPPAQNNLGPSRSYRSPNSGGYHIGGQTSPKPYGAQNDYYDTSQQTPQPQAPAYQSYSSNTGYHNGSQDRSQQQQPSTYAQPKPYDSNYPPSYRTQAPGNDIVSPVTPSALTPGGGAVGRKPVQGGLRDY